MYSTYNLAYGERKYTALIIQLMEKENSGGAFAQQAEDCVFESQSLKT